MKIFRVHLNVYHFKEMKEFYTNFLQMELVFEDEESFAVLAGTTKIYFEKSLDQPYYHVCFRLGSDYFDEMFNCLKMENLLFSNNDYEISMHWKGKQAYFHDPDGNILEILERPFRHGNVETGGWYDVGEVGFPNHNLYEFCDYLSSDIENQYDAENDRFSFFGNEDGAFVLVKTGRNWYPTNRGAKIHPIKLVVSGIRDTQLKHPTLPYEITVIE